MGRHRHARAETHAREIEEERDLALGQWKDLVIASDDVSRRGQRIGLVEHRIGEADRDLVHRPRVDHVAEIDQPDHARSPLR